jgi:hypothetical protein
MLGPADFPKVFRGFPGSKQGNIQNISRPTPNFYKSNIQVNVKGKVVPVLK